MPDVESQPQPPPPPPPPPLIVERDGHLQILTLNRPNARNAVNLALAVALGEALDAADSDRDVWAVIVTGAGDKAFCAGADLKALSRGEAITATDPRQAAWGFAGFSSHHISKPVIAAVNGFALGGGMEIVLACDLVVCVDTASFGLPEVGKGLYAAAGGVFRLPTQVPRKVAMEMMLTGEPITARRALEVGLVNRVVAAEELLSAAKQLAERICANAPLAVQASKRIALGMVDGEVASERDAWAQNSREGMALMATADAQEGPLAFAEKRAPRWSAR